MPPSSHGITNLSVKIIEFVPRYSEDFKRLNLEWLEQHFVVEAIDLDVLSNPIERILQPGGQIFLARLENKIIGTAALLFIDAQSFELTKMSVTEKFQGKGIGKRLAQESIAWFKRTGASRLFLESSSKLTPALKLYESLGFVHHGVNPDSHYQRSDVYMVYHDPN